MPRNIKPFGIIVLFKYTEGSMSCFGSLSTRPFLAVELITNTQLVYINSIVTQQFLDRMLSIFFFCSYYFAN